MLKPYPLAGNENRLDGRSPEDSSVLPFPFGVLSPADTAVSDFPDWDGDGSDCTRYTLLLSAYLDGELDSETQFNVVSHLDSCPHCAATYAAMLETDQAIQREWRDSAPLPSSSEMRFAVDAIMAALPPVPDATPTFAPKRVHARARWMRFATGIAGVIALLGLLWSSYRFGFEKGKLSIVPNLPGRPNNTPNPPVEPRRPETSSRFSLPSAFRPLTTLPAFPPPSLMPSLRRRMAVS